MPTSPTPITDKRAIGRLERGRAKLEVAQRELQMARARIQQAEDEIKAAAGRMSGYVEIVLEDLGFTTDQADIGFNDQTGEWVVATKGDAPAAPAPPAESPEPDFDLAEPPVEEISDEDMRRLAGVSPRA